MSDAQRSSLDSRYEREGSDHHGHDAHPVAPAAMPAPYLGQHAVSVETAMAHTAAVRAGDRLEATATEDQRSKQFARYTVRVTANGERLVALFHGTVYRKETLWDGPAR